VTAVLPDTVKDQPLAIWFQDEARVGQQGTLTRIWAKRGTRPRAPRDRRYASAHLFGAVCPARAVGAAWVVPKANAWAMNLHLSEISAQVAPGAHAVVVLDKAGWHQTGGELQVPANLSLLHLPPDSPELHPVENVWEDLRQNELSFRIWPTYQAILETCCAAWNALVAKPDLLASITRRDWASVAVPSLPVKI
jgi:hypothetical protein